MKRSAAWKRYLIAFLIGLSMALLMLLSRSSFAKEVAADRYKDFSDAFFVPGILFASIGVLVFASNNGIFDMIKFGAIKVVSMMRSEKHRAEIPHTYYDYLTEKSAKARAKYGFLLVTGAAFVFVSVFFAFM